MAEVLLASDVVPEGALQIVCGSIGDLLDHVTCQDVVGFTGSAATGELIRSHPRVVSESVRVNIEADILGKYVRKYIENIHKQKTP